MAPAKSGTKSFPSRSLCKAGPRQGSASFFARAVCSPVLFRVWCWGAGQSADANQPAPQHHQGAFGSSFRSTGKPFLQVLSVHYPPAKSIDVVAARRTNPDGPIPCQCGHRVAVLVPP